MTKPRHTLRNIAFRLTEGPRSEALDRGTALRMPGKIRRRRVGSIKGCWNDTSIEPNFRAGDEVTAFQM